MWNFVVGTQYQINKHFMIRAEAGFLGSRTQFIGDAAISFWTLKLLNNEKNYSYSSSFLFIGYSANSQVLISLFLGIS